MTPIRLMLGAALVVLVALGIGGWLWLNPTYDGPSLSVAQAHDRAVAGEITLIDIRRPDEWAATGVGEGAVPIDMRDVDFTDQILALVPDRNAPVALICAAGVRSARLSNRLAEAGFTNIIDVPEGMSGSRAGPGWMASGLPTGAPS